MQHTLARLQAGFLRSELLLQQPEVLAVFLGGSRLYAASEEQSEATGTLSDWDGVIIVNTKNDIFALVNEHRLALMRMLRVEQEECSRFRVPTPSSQVWSGFDGVRFAGYDKLGAKRSVKILSMEYFSQRKTSLNILSNKDRRVYGVVNPGSSAPTISYQIQQATTISDQLTILHDQWIYNACDKQQKLSQQAFGVTADLLVSGACLVGRTPYGQEIKQRILEYYSSVVGNYPTILTFAKSSRFSSQYISWLTDELPDLQPPHTSLLSHQANTCSPHPKSRYWHQMLFCDTATTLSPTYLGALSPIKILSQEASQEFEHGAISRIAREEISSFTSNSKTYDVITAGRNGAKINIFCKESRYAEDELKGAQLASAFYPRTIIPRMSTSGTLLYPFLHGTTEADLRLLYIQGGRKDLNAVETLLHAELVKAEDMLRSYRISMTTDIMANASSCQNLHRFFHSRLVDDTRLCEFYGSTIQLLGEPIPVKKFLEMPWVINGKRYPTLRRSFDTALAILSPTALQASCCPVAFGLGDAHGGNIMIQSKYQQNNSRGIVFIDYEVAGFHPVMLDLAKPVYNDVFFETLYLDLAPDATIEGVSCRIMGGDLVLDFTPLVDPISQAILDIKLRYLIQPLCNEVHRAGGSLENHVLILANALFLCATLTRNFAENKAAFIRNFATGIILSKAGNWKEFAACLETLGFTTSGFAL